MTNNQQVWELIGGHSEARLERLRRVHCRVLPAGCVITASLFYSTEFSNKLYATSAVILTLSLLVATLALHLWPQLTLRTLRISVFTVLLGINAGMVGAYQEAIHHGGEANLQLSGWVYGLSLLIIVVHTLYSPLGARFTALALWFETTVVALVGLAFFWNSGGPMEQPLLETMRFVIAGGVTIGVMQVFSQISAVQLRAEVQNSLLEYRAYTDALTELPNRRAFQTQSRKQFDAARHANRPLSLIAIDIDCFKAINDVHGHDTGDRVLQKIAGVIRQMTGPSNYPVRWGGDEFAVLLPGCDQEQALSVAERLRAGIGALGEQTNHSTVSIGVALYRDGDSLEQLFRRADRGLYRAKAMGRNRVEIAAQQSPAELPIKDSPTPGPFASTRSS